MLHVAALLPESSGTHREIPLQCSNATSVLKNVRSVTKVNLTGRRPGGDYVSVLNIDEPGSDGLYGLHQMDVVGFNGPTPADGLELHGFDVEVVSDSKLNFWMINHRAPIDENGQYLDPTKVGTNSTVELFSVERGSDQLQYESTVASDAIYTPNSLVVTGDGGFVVTNDKSQKGKLPPKCNTVGRLQLTDFTI